MGVVSCGTTMLDQGVFQNIGAVTWDTTAKTANFTAVSGNGYFVNTTSGAITLTLPAGSAGDIVGISDYASTFQTNNLTITPNGTDKINGLNENAVLNTKGIAVSLVYVDSTRGWKSVLGSDSDTTGEIPPGFTTATGGTITCCGDYKIHTFTSPGTFSVSAVGNGPTICGGGPSTVNYMVVAGGGGGGAAIGGGGGAGGFREGKQGTDNGTYTASPLTASCSGLPISVTSYPITVGAGGGGGNNCGTKATIGSNSIFSTITSAGGGADQPCASLKNGGSGSGGTHQSAGGSGNTPPVSPPQGQPGGSNSPGPVNTGQFAGGGGGGAGGAGTPSSSNGYPSNAGPGGGGVTTSINGSPVTRAGGGGGGVFLSNSPGAGGSGGGGAGAGVGPLASPGTVNTGGGGGGGAQPPGNPQGGSGGSGIVIIRYKYQ